MLFRYAVFILLLVATGPGAAAAAPAGADPARQVVAGLHEALLESMKSADETGVEKRYASLKEALTERFNFRLMAAITSGSSWRKASEAEQDRLTEAFRRFSIANYASRFSSYSGERFEITGTREGPSGTVLVDTLIHPGSGEPVQISYVLREYPESWQIVDVLLDGGISELAMKRSEYRSVLSDEGIEGLVALLNEKADALVGEAGRAAAGSGTPG